MKIYCLSTGRTFPVFLTEKQKRSLKKDDDYTKRLDLIQDLDFPGFSSHAKFSSDGRYLFTTGGYPPQMKCFDLSELSMKFERHMDFDVVQFQLLADDYTKLVFLGNDRSIEFHAQFGKYYRTRIPKVGISTESGRDICYVPDVAELYVAGAGSEVYRLNLHEGRFMLPLQTAAPANSVVKRNPLNGLVAVGGDNGTVTCFDPRAHTPIGTIVPGTQPGGLSDPNAPGSSSSIRALRFHSNGLTMAVGTGDGYVLMYDLRAPTPFLQKNHQYGLPIVDVKFHEASRTVISADPKAVRIWTQDEAVTLGSIEPKEDVRSVCIAPDSGLLFVPGEQPRVGTYFVPALGPAPRWCSYLDQVSEEFDQKEEATVFDDYKFVTRADLEKLGLTDLIGTPMLKAYMHGFWINSRLYQRAFEAADPLAVERRRKEQIQKRLEEQRKTRIALPKKLPAVNSKLAAKIMLEQQAAEADEEMSGEDEDEEHEDKEKKTEGEVAEEGEGEGGKAAAKGKKAKKKVRPGSPGVPPDLLFAPTERNFTRGGWSRYHLLSPPPGGAITCCWYLPRAREVGAAITCCWCLPWEVGAAITWSRYHLLLVSPTGGWSRYHLLVSTGGWSRYHLLLVSPTGGWSRYLSNAWMYSPVGWSRYREDFSPRGLEPLSQRHRRVPHTLLYNSHMLTHAHQADLLADGDRFPGLFSDRDFEIDEDSSEYRLLHPTMSKAQTRLLSHFERVADTTASAARDDAEADDLSDGDEAPASTDLLPNDDQMAELRRAEEEEEEEAEGDGDGAEEDDEEPATDRRRGAAGGAQFFELKDGADALDLAFSKPTATATAKSPSAKSQQPKKLRPGQNPDPIRAAPARPAPRRATPAEPEPEADYLMPGQEDSSDLPLAEQIRRAQAEMEEGGRDEEEAGGRRGAAGPAGELRAGEWAVTVDSGKKKQQPKQTERDVFKGADSALKQKRRGVRELHLSRCQGRLSKWAGRIQEMRGIFGGLDRVKKSQLVLAGDKDCFVLEGAFGTTRVYTDEKPVRLNIRYDTNPIVQEFLPRVGCSCEAHAVMERLRAALERFPDQVNAANSAGWTPLRYVVQLGTKELGDDFSAQACRFAFSPLTVMAFLRHSPDFVNLRTDKGLTVLHYVAQYQTNEFPRLQGVVPDLECLIDTRTKDGNTAAHYAGACRRRETLDYLYSMGSDRNLRNSCGFTPEDKFAGMGDKIINDDDDDDD
ncbi:putative Nucleolar protein 10 [Paratrimastix pyriformis]|uniref:Nucleolar protein 10 n=1 Tax=Paratrimastix pyriformis TaxID=342808 RepID=A0ABQ8UDI8_9EUKA|nr:putative Nucleolar protein 10 [Paratrimastix pyriformis]